jgi:hypothetical protein
MQTQARVSRVNFELLKESLEFRPQRRILAEEPAGVAQESRGPR